jgi:uronate dehydrogenase
LKRVAMTGAAGHIGTRLRSLIAQNVEHLRLIDVARPENLTARESFVRADLVDRPAMERALESMDAVIHLGGISSEADIDAILRANVLGTYNLYEAVRANGVTRVVAASSNHATGFFPRSETISPADFPRPDSRYGLSKCWGELLAGFYYDTAGIRTLSIRIGNAGDHPLSERTAAIWISARDLAQLITIGLTHPDLAAAVVYGASRTDAAWWDNSIAYRLGYEPQDHSRDHLRIGSSGESDVAAYFQGGGFCDGDHDGTIRLRDRDGLAVERRPTS